MAPRARLIALSLLALPLAVAPATPLAGMLTAARPAAPSAELSRVVAHDVVAPVPVPSAPSRPAAKRPTPQPHRASPRPVRVSAPARAVRRAPAAALTPEQLMQRAIARLPGYHPGDAVFTITPGLGNWGLAELHSGVVYISPRVPSKRMYDVVAHEWSHVLSVKTYDGDVDAALAAMNGWFGGSDLVGAERAADCMARLLGATWTHYTPCTDSRWRAGAERLLHRQRL